MTDQPMTPAELAAILRVTLKRTNRFWAQVDRRGPDECWPWIGRRSPKGYGEFDSRGLHFAHRFSLALDGRPAPTGMVSRHTCDNPPCVNPHHLLVGTVAENNRDRSERGGWASGWSKNPKPDCPAGHSKAVYARRHATNGKVWCLLCHRATQQRRRERLRAAG